MTSNVIELDEIEDLRTYERHRKEMKTEMIEYRRLRRVALGEIMSITFENKKTIKYQIQEMARAERMSSDEQIRSEILAYGNLIPEPGQLVGTLFIELTSRSELMHWLPILTGVERCLWLDTPSGSFQSYPEADHAAQLTRADITPSVHYLKFDLDIQTPETFINSPISVRVAHENYEASAYLSEELKRSLTMDWQS